MNDKKIQVKKRNTTLEDLNPDKIHKVINWATKDLENVSTSEIEMKAKIQFYDGIETKVIQQMLIKSAADLISEEHPNYVYVAAKLLIFHLRKIAFGQYTPPSLLQHITKLTEQNLYDKTILENYNSNEINELDKIIVHERDMNFSYAAVKQLEGKYLLQNRVTKQIYETPQFLYMLVSMCLFMNYPKETRLSYVKRFYEAISTFKISLPTPIMGGLRTPTKQFASCILVECEDSLNSIIATTGVIIKYISQRAGLGINAGRIRSVNSLIRKGEAKHTGAIPFFKVFQSAVKSCSQGGIRNGAATLFYPIWHKDFEEFIVLKNNRGVEDNRVRGIDYGIQINRLMYQRVIKNQNITLFCPNDVPDLYSAFFRNQNEFEKLYVQYENNPNIQKKTLPAIEVFSKILTERSNTGRIYIQNVDHCNTHSAFNPDLAPIKQSNLCMEITLPTKPLKNLDDDQGEIALCTLSAINLGVINNLEELESLSDLVVRSLDNLLDYQDYPVLAAELSTKKRRSLGIGVINYSYYLTKNNMKYSDFSANNLTHKTFEALQYYLLKASNNLAKEKGACQAFNETNYSKGILPIDTYKKDIDEFCQEPLHLDWETLRQNIIQYGLRNSTLTSLMPSETSSQIANATNGIEPPRGLITIKASKDGILSQLVPDFEKLKDKYELLWDMKDNKGYLQLVSIMQKFVDQSISTNTNYDPERFPNNKIPMQIMLQDLLISYKYGIKTLYYHNTNDRSNHTQSDLDLNYDCLSGACKI